MHFSNIAAGRVLAPGGLATGWVETGSDPVGLPDIKIALAGYPVGLYA